MLRKLPVLILICCFGLAAFPAGAASLLLTPEVVTALDMLGRGIEISKPQKALLFANNDAINSARQNNWISDRQYQAAQSLYTDKVSELSVGASDDVGVPIERQKAKSSGYKAGTDTDNIATITKVEQIEQLESAFNRRARAYLEENKIEYNPETIWHEKLNVDFMADPENISQADFERIAAQKDSFYKRRKAAEAEKILRINTEQAPMLNADHIEAYTLEMQEFIAKRNKFLKAARKNMEYFKNPANKAELLLLMGQEQKYTERLEALNDRVRLENKLTPVEREMPGGSHIVIRDKNGNPVMKYKRVRNAQGHVVFQERRIGSISARGSMRNPENFDAYSGSAVAENSVHRALADLAETRAQIAATNPHMADNAANAVAQIARELPPPERAAALERIRKARGNDFASEVARHMREASPPKPEPVLDAEFARTVDKVRETLAHEGPKTRVNPILEQTRAWDESFQRAIGISTDKAEMSLTRQQVNGLVERGLPKFNALLDKVFMAQTAWDAGSEMGEYAYHISTAMDPNTPDAVAQQHFEAAQHVAYGMIATGTLGAAMTVAMEAFPTVGAVVGTYGATYEGSRFVLENTRTGQYIDKVAGGTFDIGFRGVDKLSDLAAVLTGGETQAQREQREGSQLCDSYSRALQEGRIKLRDGVSVDELQDACMNRDIGYIKSDLIEDTTPDKPEPKPFEIPPPGHHYAVGLFVNTKADNWDPTRRIGIVVSPQELEFDYKFEDRYKNLKILKPNLTEDEARQFIFLALFSEGSPAAKGTWMVGTYTDPTMLADHDGAAWTIKFDHPAIDRFEAGQPGTAYFNARMKGHPDLEVLRDGLSYDESGYWLCLQTKIFVVRNRVFRNKYNQEFISLESNDYVFRGKRYMQQYEHCDAFEEINERSILPDGSLAPGRNKVRWGIRISKAREEWILDHLTMLKAMPLPVAPASPPADLVINEGGGKDQPQSHPESWEDIAEALQGDLPNKPSPAKEPQRRNDTAPPVQSGSGTKNPQSWDDVAQQMQGDSGVKSPQSWGDVAQQMQGTRDHDHDLGYILQNRHNPDLVSPAQLEAALNHPHFWQQPEAQQFIDDWFGKALPELASKDPTARYEKWGRITGRGITIAGDPDIHEPRYQYLWRNADKFPSLNLCSMKEFVKRRLMEQSTADCPVAKSAAPSPGAKQETNRNGSTINASSTPTNPVQKNMSVQCTVAADATIRKLEAVQRWTHHVPVLGNKPIVAIFLPYWDKLNFDFNGVEQKWSSYLDKVEIVALSGDAPKGGNYGSLEDMDRLTVIPFGLDVKSRVHYDLSGNMVRDLHTYPHILVFNRSGYLDEDIPGYEPTRDDTRLRKAIDKVVAQPCGQKSKARRTFVDSKK